jgi:hypothetical protein
MIMILTINLDKKSLQETLETFFVKVIRYSYGWLSSDGEVLGYIIGVYHILIAISIPILIFLSHTIYPSSWLKLGIFVSMIFIFAQHIILNICVLIPVEEMLTKKQTIFYPILEQFLLPFNISVAQFVSYIVVSEGTAIICLGLELISHISRFGYKYYGIAL